MHEILCSAPVGDGAITLHGDAGLPGVHETDLALNVENVPVSVVGQLARRAKKNLPADLLSSGSVQGNFTVKEDRASQGKAEFQGRGEITDLRLQSASTKVDFAPGTVPFALRSKRVSVRALNRKSPGQLSAEVLPAPDGLRIEYGPFPVALGRPAPVQVRGWVARSGYGMVVRGDGEVSYVLRLGSLLGLPAVKANVEGVSDMELQIAGAWAGSVSGTASGFSLPEVTGTVQLRNVRALVRGVNGPIEISSAELRLLRDEARVEKLSARAADADWTGWLALPRGCGTPGACLIRFNLNTEELDLSLLSEWLSSHPSERRWYQLLTSAEPATPSFLANLRASGKVSAARFLIRNLIANRVSAALDLEPGKLKISDLQADLLGGKHRSNWQADFTADSPVYAGSGTLTGISLRQVADAMHDPWISGTLEGTYRLTASGADAAAFWQSADGGLQFDLLDGVLSHISLAADEGPLRIARWQDRARLRDGKVEIDKGKLVSPAGAYEVSGTASLGQALDFKLTRAPDVRAVHAGSLAYNITGTVAEPRIALTTTPETQARLKP
jgi:hypothetical protein